MAKKKHTYWRVIGQIIAAALIYIISHVNDVETLKNHHIKDPPICTIQVPLKPV